MNPSSFFRSAAALASASLALAARADNVDFEDLAGQGETLPDIVGYGPTVVSGGFRVSGLALFSFLPSATPFGGNYSGSIALWDGNSTTTVTMAKVGGGAFGFDPASPVTFVGALSGGGTVTQTFHVGANSTTLQTLAFAGFEMRPVSPFVDEAPTDKD